MPHGLTGRPSNHKSHGLSTSPEYHIWANMLHRTRATKGKAYEDYAARGITVCPRWLAFENFYKDIGPRPSVLHSIERLNNDGNYEPGNCQWALPTQQANNKRTSHKLTFKGRTLTVAQWANEIGLSDRTLWYRLERYGWSIERALTSPLVPQRLRANRQVKLTHNGETRSISDWGRCLNIPISTLFNRRARGCSVERTLRPVKTRT